MPQQELQPGAISEVAEERWKLVKDILSSRSFAKAPRLSGFLAYICAETLCGRGSDLNERQIGLEVFGRSPDYLPAEDSIVRASARLLRNRLELYFSTEGKDSDWVIFIPKGSYIPTFESRIRKSEPASPLLPIDVPQRIVKPADGPRSQRLPMLVISMIAAAIAIFAGILLHRHIGSVTANPERQIWSTLLTGRERTLFVPADSTLSLIQTAQNVPLTVSEYLGQKPAVLARLAASGPYPQAMTNINDHQYTSIADLEMAFRVGRLPQAGNAQLEVRYARDLTLSDIKNSNLILMGGPRANPWVQIFAEHVDYSLDDHPADGLDYVNVRSPQSGESARYMAAVKGNQTFSLGVIAFISGLEGGKHVLMIEGTDMAGTQGACDFLLDANASSAVLSKLIRPDGRVGHFEMLLETKTVTGNASEHLVLAYRPLP
ncbi:Adenylate cyclase [Acidisarcina polymorpha]|uniref:Adenylate cyclase n=2 Tax=Acidisarcina polymorpha TaxID=2211140 RepID=A0A2Z5FUR0_9BACT|nr:Adenylate cyclase [Acidisarcina polymorpha]